jgi:hypothetical protein
LITCTVYLLGLLLNLAARANGLPETG